jgi:hypothetical protein
MDALARAAEQAFAASREDATGLPDFPATLYDPRGFARVNGKKLVQVKGRCSALDLCEMTSNPISLNIRCESCGYCCHISCQLKLRPSLSWLKSNRVCKGCIRDLGLTVLGRKEVLTDDNDLQAYLELNHRSFPLTLVSQQEFEIRSTAHEDGLDSDIEDSEKEQNSNDDQQEKEDSEMDITKQAGTSILGYSGFKYLVIFFNIFFFRFCQRS